MRSRILDWLEAILHCFETSTLPIGCIGGKIDPIWEAPRPSWLPNDYLSYLTILNWGDEPIVIDRSKYVAGANMAFQAHLLRQVGGFNTELGRKGKNLLSSEEVWATGADSAKRLHRLLRSNRHRGSSR